MHYELLLFYFLYNIVNVCMTNFSYWNILTILRGLGGMTGDALCCKGTYLAVVGVSSSPREITKNYREGINYCWHMHPGTNILE